ncbi:MAG: hypothetical protein JHC87_10350, partial [Thermoleophilaceae bacterium]|nr:hypothetical protein [Thermoleophilaceae bacterium]
VARGIEEGDRFEEEGVNFQRHVASAYRQIAKQAEERIVTITGDRTSDEIHEDVLALVRGRLGDTLA